MQPKNLLRQLTLWATGPSFVFVILFLVAVLAYGLFIPWLHLYIDDWIWVWTWEKLGRAGLVKYFSANRPMWGLLFQVTLPLLGKNVLVYHLFSFIIRLGSALCTWWLIRLLWPKRSDIAFFSALFFLIYPGFILQPIALTYGHLFLIYIFFLLSLCFNILALRKPHRFLPYSILAILLSAANLLTMEYFFTLELIRPVILWLLTAEIPTFTTQPDQAGTARKWTSTHLFRAILQWLPYLLLMIGVVAWRVFSYKVITVRYHLSLLDQLRASPFTTLIDLGQTILLSLWNVTIGAWVPAINRLVHMNLRQSNSLLTLLLIGFTALLVFSALFIHSWRQPQPDRKSFASSASSAQIVAFGAVLLLFAGWPFWLTGLHILPVTDKSRFTIPFILGAAVFFSGLVNLITSVRIRSALLALLIALACGYHFQVANTYRIEWEQNRQLMWQIALRIPNMQEGTTLFITDFPVTTYDTATLMTELNMIYPVTERYPDLAYNILYDREQDEILPQGLVKDVPLDAHNVTSWFHGSTSQVLSAQYNLSRCFRLLNPDLDAQDPLLPEFTRKAVQLSNWQWIDTHRPPSQPSSQWFGKEPADQWCYYFEKADLARQMGDWTTAADLGDAAQSKGLSARDEMEKLVFIEAYAHTDQWDRAVEISQAFQNPDRQSVLCLLWQRINTSTPEGEEKAAAFQKVNQSGTCPAFKSAP